jgi:hypothetical protein
VPTAETARLIASLELQDKNFTRGIGRVEQGVSRVDKKLSAFGGFVNRNLGRAIDSVAARLVGTVGTGLEELATLEDATTSVAGAIGQVGKGWTTTADDIATAANRIEASTDAAFDDKAIVAATETLIRYGKVSEKNLEPAMQVMTDLAAKTGDVDSASSLLAKALADPAKAAGKLARVGIILTKGQQKQIKAMMKAGDVAGAQALLLGELEKSTKGAAAASAGPYRDALNKLGDAGEDLRRGFVTGLAPAILEVADLLTDELAKPETLRALKSVGVEVGAVLKSVIGIAKSLPWDSIGDAMRLAGTGAKAVLDAFLGLPPWVQTAVLTGWGLNKITGGGLSGLFGKGLDLFKNRGSTPANPLFVEDVTGGGAGPLGLGGGAGLAGGLKGALKGLFRGGLTFGLVAADVVLFERLITEIGTFNTTVTTSQKDLGEKVETTRSQSLEETIANLNATANGIRNMAPWDQAIASIWGGGQITENFNMAAERLVRNAGMNADELEASIAALKNARSIAAGELLDTTVLDGAIATLSERLRNAVPLPKPKGSPQTGDPGMTSGGGGNPAAAARQTSDRLVNRVEKLDAKTAATTAAVQGAKDAVKHLTAKSEANAAAQHAATIAGTALAAVQGTMQAVRDAVQTSTIRSSGTTAANASRSAGQGVEGELSALGNRIVGAIWAARPAPARVVVQSNTIIQKQAVSDRGGAASDSRTRGGV